MINLIQKSLFTFAILLTLVSCGAEKKLFQPETKTVQASEPAVSEEFSYAFRERKCETGEHTFSTFAAVCGALKEVERNNDCAEEEREDLFVGAECPGDFADA